MSAFHGSSDWIDPNHCKAATPIDPNNLPVAYGTPMSFSSLQNNDDTISSAARAQLKEQGFTNGLIESLQVNKRAFPMRFWIVDNSGSMAKADGHRIISMKNSTYKFADCSRWREMQECVDYHSQMATVLHSPTTFRLLNPPGAIAGPQTFSVGQSDEQLALAQSVMMNTQPGGVTPLAQHIQEIRNRILTELQGSLGNAKIAIVLATDGLPTDARGYSNTFVKQQFVDALRSLEGLPVWIVVRLCTDEDEVVSYWNDLDASLELSMEVLDDFAAEAQEVHDCNKWLNYCLPLHRIREMGFYHRIFDLMDERAFSKGELRDFMQLLFGSQAMAEVPDPEEDWKGFCEMVELLLSKESKQWNPLSKRLEPWIDMKKLKRQYGGKHWFGMF